MKEELAREFEIGVKVYDSDWFVKYGLSYSEAAKLLKDWGCNFVLAQSKHLRMPDSAVKSVATPQEAERYAQLDDRAFRDALAEEGIDYWATVCMFFDPREVEENPHLRPVGADGQPMEMIDWYLGIAPSHDDFVERRIEQIAAAVEALKPAGVFLSFMRWPGFWELWRPEWKQSEFPEYCFSEKILRKFSDETGIEIPISEPVRAAGSIQSNFGSAWAAWKCRQVFGVIDRLKTRLQTIDPQIQLMLNTVPFGTQDYQNAQKSYFGQDVEQLADVIDVFEVMTYHQILNRPVEWIPTIGQEMKSRVGKKTYCTLQVRPHYIEGMHADYGRPTELPVEEFCTAISLVEENGLDGVVIFVWSDLLEEMLTRNNDAHIQGIWASKSNRKKRVDQSSLNS